MAAIVTLSNWAPSCVVAPVEPAGTTRSATSTTKALAALTRWCVKFVRIGTVVTGRSYLRSPVERENVVDLVTDGEETGRAPGRRLRSRSRQLNVD